MIECTTNVTRRSAHGPRASRPLRSLAQRYCRHVSNKRNESTGGERTRRAEDGTKSSADSDGSVLPVELVAADADERPPGTGHGEPSGSAFRQCRLCRTTSSPTPRPQPSKPCRTTSSRLHGRSHPSPAELQAPRLHGRSHPSPAELQAPDSTAAAIQALQNYKLPDSTAAAIQALQNYKLPDSTAAAIQALQNYKLPDSTAAAIQALQNYKLPRSGATSISSSGLNEWEETLDLALRGPRWPAPRRHREPSDFFGAFEVEVNSLSQLLGALTVIQRKNSALGLVWRGHQDAEWPVDSSLTRSLRAAGRKLGEDELIAVEKFQLAAAGQWGYWPTLGEMNFYAQLQHDGVPTRLIDVSLDPEVAAWFAVEQSEANDPSDGRLICWGRSATPRRNRSPIPPQLLPPGGGDAFWQQWSDRDARRANEWGTGRAMPSWQPLALNERMRAQRAAFLFDAEPILDADLLEVFSDRLGEEWKVKEIAQATRVLGLPSRHDVKAPANDARVVPIFSVRIASDAKAEIRRYLSDKGLIESTIYPDRAGLVSYLRRVGGAGEKLEPPPPILSRGL